jgi:endonuclease/exonuclease/phosphatase family metal-dependent hydrolase
VSFPLSPRWFAVALLLGVMSGGTAAEESKPRTLRVLTYNIHHGEGTDGKLDLERQAEVIKAAKADIVALQEVDQNTERTGGIDQAARLGELTGLRAIFGKAMDYRGGAYGLAVLSRWPLGEAKTDPLPADEGIEPRALLSVRVQPREGVPEFMFLVTHLDAGRDPGQRIKQAARIRELFPAAGNDTPAILAGDFNAIPESPVIKSFLAGWTDSAAGSAMLTSPAGMPRRRIDYIFFRPTARWRVISTEALDEPIASDHRPVLSMLELLQ